MAVNLPALDVKENLSWDGTDAVFFGLGGIFPHINQGVKSAGSFFKPNRRNRASSSPSPMNAQYLISLCPGEGRIVTADYCA
jgi:hypothetical protein